MIDLGQLRPGESLRHFIEAEGGNIGLGQLVETGGGLRQLMLCECPLGRENTRLTAGFGKEAGVGRCGRLCIS